MRKILIVLMLFLSCSVFAQIFPINGPDNLSFTTTIKSLNNSTDSELNEFIETGTWLVLDGSLSALTLQSGKDEEYHLEALLVQGEWVGLDEVLKYQCKLIFLGNVWKDIVPDKTPRNVKEGMILLNSHIMVLGKIVDFERTGDDSIIPSLVVSQIRVIP